MMTKDSVKTTSVSLALFSLGICLFVWGILSGFEKGYFYGMFKEVSEVSNLSFSGVGETNYFHAINFWYLIIALGFCGYIAGKLIEPLFLSSIACIFSLCIVIYPFWDMLHYKNNILNISNHYRDNFWLNISIYFDWLLLLNTAILLAIQFTLINTRKLENQSLKINRLS